MQLPARVGKYELQEFLGGGMAHVYRARDTVLGRTVALKIMTEASCADPEAKARFLHEARMAGNIVHDNIISIYDFGEEQNRPYIVMEFLRGNSLRELIKQNKAGDLKQKLQIALQAGRALEYIHTKKITHRDVKPENIHVDAQGKIKLMDFGIAKSEGLALTRAGFTLGTPYYMAPEQVMGQQVTQQVDVYAFGILLAELVSGTKPVTGETVEKIFNSILYDPLNLEPLKKMGVPHELIALISRCTAKQPASRPPGLGPVCDEIDKILKMPLKPLMPLPQPPQAGPLPTTKPAAKPTAKPPTPAPRPPRPVRQPDPDIPAFLSFLPPNLRTQQWLMVFTAGTVLAVMALFYFLLSSVLKIL